MLKHIKARMENALRARTLAEQQYDGGEHDLHIHLDTIVGQLKNRLDPRKHAVDDVTYRIETFNRGEETSVGVRLTLHRTQHHDTKYYETSLLLIRDLDDIFAKQGMMNWSCENFDDNSRITTIVYL
ncbi:hypothetical protein D3C75_587800 [compost metagenome]